MTRTDDRAIATPRLTLEPTASHHAQGLWDATLASLEELRPWMAWAVEPSFEDTLAFTTGAARQWEIGSGWIFTILRDDEPAGTLGLGQYRPLFAAAELGYWIRSDAGGRGLMTEAASAVVGYGFERLGLHRIELHAAPDNAASIRVAEKLGFRREGILRHGARGAGGFHDVYVYGLLAGDERPRPEDAP